MCNRSAYTIQRLRSYLHKLNLDPVKFKCQLIGPMASKNNVAFITFRNEAAREVGRGLSPCVVEPLCLYLFLV